MANRYFLVARYVLLLLSASVFNLAQAALPALPMAKGGEVPTLAPLLSEVTPAVVNIAVLSKAPMEENPLANDPFFRRFFDLPERAQARPQVSAGSGVIVDAAKGYVLTNHHVIKDAQQILVTLKDRRQFDAKLIGTDPGTDVALLKIEPDKLVALKFGNSDALNVGDFVLAIGNPFGLGQTVTSGIISALGRTGLNIEGYEDFIQTDASINPGNSGGALVNLRGELIGVNTAIIGPAGGNVGIGFAVPSSMVRSVMEQLVKYGEVRRGRLGMETQDVTPELAKALRLANADGAVVTRVEPGSPGARAGLRPRDVIVAVAGRPVRGSADVRNRVGLVPIGDEVEFRLIREGATRTVKAQVGRPYEFKAGRGENVPQLAGLTIANIERGMPLYGQVQGVLVADVEQGSPAFRHGLRPGDVILGVNRKPVRNSNELVSALRAAEGALTVTLLRGEFKIVIIIR